jgi:hypothetical protein
MSYALLLHIFIFWATIDKSRLFGYLKDMSVDLQTQIILSFLIAGVSLVVLYVIAWWYLIQKKNVK